MRYIIVFVHALAAVIYQLIFGNPVTAAAKVPDTITPGQNFTVEVTITKPQVAGFAKFQIELPPDYVATEGDSRGGTFSTSGTTAKIIWTAVPTDEVVTIKINVAAPASANGNKELTGKFSYIENNVKQQAEIVPVALNVSGASANPVTTTETTPTPETTPAPETQSVTSTETPATNTATTTTGDNAQSFSQPTEPDASVVIRRQVTSNSTPNNFEITLTVQKGAITGFAKLAEKIPEGFVATQVATADASFAFEDGFAKFIWASLPSAEQMVLTYKLTPDPNGGIVNPSVIEGSMFSYLENNQTKKVALSSETLVTTPTEKIQAAVTTPTAPAASENTTTDNSAATNNSDNTNVTSGTNSSATENTTTAKETATTQASAPQNGNIHYSVQIGAFRNGVNAGSLKQKYGIGEAVHTEMTEGFTKCIYGKFNEYKMARDSREVAKGKGVDGAFVTAYNSGKRITVQEALMVSNQKWYK